MIISDLESEFWDASAATSSTLDPEPVPRSRERKRRRCGLCGGVGHNARSCEAAARKARRLALIQERVIALGVR